MKHQVLICSYAKDFEWLKWNLTTLRRFSKGFLPPVICVASDDEPGARFMVNNFYPEATVTIKDGRPGLGNLRAQVAMMSGDLLCPEADYVWLVGSDCLVSRTFQPDAFFRDGLPVMLINTYGELLKVAPGILPWQKGVEDALGFSPNYEYMRRLPLMYPRALFKKVRDHIAAHTKKPFEEYVYDVGAYAQRSNRSDAANFSESNVLGAWAHKFEPDMFHWLCLDHCYESAMKEFPNPMIQFWSHGGMDFPCDCRFGYGSGKNTFGKTPREVIRDILNETHL